MTVDVEERMTTEVFSAEPHIFGLGETLTATLDVEDVTVVLFGPQLTLEAISQTDLRVDLDLLGLLTGTYEIEPTVTVPIERVEIRERQPAVVTVMITSSITSSITATVTPTDGTSGAILNKTVQSTSSPLVSVPTLSPVIAPRAASTKLCVVF